MIGDWVIWSRLFRPITTHQSLNNLAQTQSSTQCSQVALFSGGEGTQGGDDAGEMGGPDLVDEGAAVFSEMNFDAAAVVFAALAVDEAAFDKVVNDEGHVAAAFENFVAQFAGGQGAEVVEGFEGAELADGQVVAAEVGVDGAADGFGRAGEFDVGVEGEGFFGCAFVFCSHSVSGKWLVNSRE